MFFIHFSVVPVENARDALTTLRTSRRNFFHLVVTDVHMPDMDGFEFQKLVREEFKLPIVSEYQIFLSSSLKPLI